MYADGLLVPTTDEDGPFDFDLELFLLCVLGSSVCPIMLVCVWPIMDGFGVAECDSWSPMLESDFLLKEERLAASAGRFASGVGSSVLDLTRFDCWRNPSS